MKYGIEYIAVKALMRRQWLETQVRVHLSLAKAEQYAEEMLDGVAFPAPVVFLDPDTEVLYIGDGFHRIMAHKLNGEKSVRVNLNRGTKLDAILWSIKHNSAQLGLPLTTADKARSNQLLQELGRPPAFKKRAKCRISTKERREKVLEAFIHEKPQEFRHSTVVNDLHHAAEEGRIVECPRCGGTGFLSKLKH